MSLSVKLKSLNSFLPTRAIHRGLYYKHVTIVNDDSSVVNKQSFKLIDDARVVIYDRNRFIIWVTSYITSLLIVSFRYFQKRKNHWAWSKMMYSLGLFFVYD